MRFCLKHRGSISLFLSIILIPVLMFIGIMVDYANLNLSKGVVEGAGDLATNAALANYDTVLNDVYGLFAMSQLEEEPEAALQENLGRYFDNTLRASGLMANDLGIESDSLQEIRDMFLNRDMSESFLGTSAVEETFQASYVKDSSLANPEILKKQIVEFMKYRGPAEVGLSMLDSLGAVKKVNEQSIVADKKVKVDEAIEDLAKESSQFYDAIDKYDKGVDEYWEAEKRFLSNKEQIGKDLISIGEAVMMYELHPIAADGLSYIGEGGLSGSVSGSGLDELSGEIGGLISTLQNTAAANIRASLQTLPDDVRRNVIKNIETAIQQYKEEFMPTAGSLCSAREKVNSISIEFPTKPEKPTAPGAEARPGEIIRYQQDMENYQGKLEEYQAKQAEAEAKQKQKEEILRKADASIASLNTDICQPMSTQINAYHKAREAAIRTATAKLTFVHTELNNYYKAAGKLGVDTQFTLDWGDTGAYTLVDFAIRKGNCVKEEMKEVAAANAAFRASNENYQTVEDQDGYYTQMANQADKYQAQFQENDVQEIINQLTCAKHFLTQTEDPLGIVPYLHSLTFYQSVIVLRPVNSLSIATEGMKVKIGAEVESGITAGEAISGAYVEARRDENWDMDKNSVIGKTAKTFYLKKISESGFPYADGLIANVPAFYVYLKNTCGMTKRDSDTKEDNKKMKAEVKEQNKEAKENSKKTGTAVEEYRYDDAVFADTPSENKNKEAIKFEDIYQSDDDNKGTTGQFSNMQGYFSSNTTGLKNVAFEGIDNLLITEYVFQNFSFATGATVNEPKEGEEQKGRGYATLTNIPITKENNVIYGCEAEYILYGHKSAKTGWWFSANGPECNITNAKRDIFALRFMCNSIFTLTDAEIDKATMPPALAIQAASSGAIPYQLTQTTFKLALALAESTYDLERLMEGEKVALLKSKNTFTFSPTGVTKESKEFLTQKVDEATGEVREVTLGAIQSAVDEAENASDRLIDGVLQQGTQAAASAMEDIVSTIVNTVTDTVEQEFMALYEEGNTYSLEALNQAVNTKLDAYTANTSKEMQGFIATVREGISAAILAQVDGELQEAYRELQRIHNKEKGVEIEGDRFRILQEKLQELGQEYQGRFTKQINKKAQEIGMEIRAKAREHITKAGEIAGGKAETIINEEGEKISQQTSEILNQYFPSETTQITGIDKGRENSVVAQKSFACSYEDYLRMFLFIKIQGTGQTAILERIADVIQMNLSGGMKTYGKTYLGRDGTGGAHGKGADFRMSEAYTYVDLTSEIKVEPLLISFDLFTPGEEGEPFQYWTYQYQTMAGY